MKKNILLKIRTVIISEEFKLTHKSRKEDFTRNRKLSFEEIILFQICKYGRNLILEIKDYLQSLGTEIKEYSKQAYSKARLKIKHTGYIELNDNLIEEFYKEDDYKKYKGYRLLGIDGSIIELEHGNKIATEFGKMNNDDEGINASRSVVVYDLLNELVIDSALNKFSSSERESAIKQLKRIKGKGFKKNDLVVFDRGFPSLEIFMKIIDLGYNFVMRYSLESSIKEMNGVLESNGDEKEIEINIKEVNKRLENKEIRRLLKKGFPNKIKLRIVKIELSDRTTEYLVTSILSPNKITIEDLKKIYHLRWNEEVYFDFQKNVIEVENFSGKSVETIKQDYYSTILVGNLHSLIVSDAQDELNLEIQKKNHLKYEEYKINKKISYALMKRSLLGLLTCRNWNKKYNQLVNEAKKHRNAVIKKRSFPRKNSGKLKSHFTKKYVF